MMSDGSPRSRSREERRGPSAEFPVSVQFPSSWHLFAIRIDNARDICAVSCVSLSHYNSRASTDGRTRAPVCHSPSEDNILQDGSKDSSPLASQRDDVLQAGAICMRRTKSGTVRVLLVGSRRSGRWGLPKGHIEAGQTPQRSVKPSRRLECAAAPSRRRLEASPIRKTAVPGFFT